MMIIIFWEMIIITTLFFKYLNFITLKRNERGTRSNIRPVSLRQKDRQNGQWTTDNGQGHMSDITEIDKQRDNRPEIFTLAGHRTQCPGGFVIVTHHNVSSIKHIPRSILDVNQTTIWLGNLCTAAKQCSWRCFATEVQYRYHHPCFTKF
jgi:hypothetical protein